MDNKHKKMDGPGRNTLVSRRYTRKSFLVGLPVILFFCVVYWAGA